MMGARSTQNVETRGRKPAPWTAQEALAAVKAFHAERGYQPVSNEACPANSLPTWHTARRLFGSWNAMIEQAGFTPYPAQNSANAKTRAYRDRNPGWRETLFAGVRISRGDQRSTA